MPGQQGTSVLKEVNPGAIGLSGNANVVALLSSADGLTARAGGGQGSATPITTRQARFSTVATGGDSSILPAAVAGLNIVVVNDGAASMNVFPQNNGDIINALAVNTAIAVANTARTVFRCFTTGKWVT